MLGIFFVCYFVFWVSIKESLPNITGEFYSLYGANGGKGAIYKISNMKGGQGIRDDGIKYGLNASRSSTTYQDNALVKPNSTSTFMLIRY